MSKKIVIDIESINKPIVRTVINKLIKEGKAIEIDTDQSIELPTVRQIEIKSEEYATDTETKEFYKDCCHDFKNGALWLLKEVAKHATDQDLISKAREKGDFYCGHAGEVICPKQCEGCKRESQFD